MVNANYIIYMINERIVNIANQVAYVYSIKHLHMYICYPLNELEKNR